MPRPAPLSANAGLSAEPGVGGQSVGRFRVLIRSEALPEDGPAFDAPADATLLASALRAGVTLASACRNGTCRSCMLRLIEGRVSYNIEWPGLLAEEKAEGWILPCVACPETDLVLALPDDRA